MALRINDLVPDFSAETDQGPLHFHEWIGSGWAILFSHPKDFTPVCTTEFGAVAQLADEWARRGTKVIGVSVDNADSHTRWKTDIEKVCSAKADCTGQCLAQGEVAPGAKAQGLCQTDISQNFGCRQRIDGGVALGTICVD